MPVLLNDENTINTTISQPETINTSLPDINYIPGYKEAEAERRANEVVRQENEASRIALYEDIEHKVETGYFNGEDGFSPVANVTKDGNTATITITDKIGTTTASIFDGTDGTDGQDGQDGFSPTATVTKSGKVATITITDKDGTTTAQIRDGEDGQGAGDMLKSTYDTNDNGIVDNAEKVNNHTVGCDVPADAVFTDTTYTAGTNVSISAQNVISATDTTYTAGTGIDITNGVISNTQTSAEWGNITGDIEDQTDLKPYLDIVAGDSEETTEKASSFTETGVLSLKDYSIYGDTTQQTYTGKNLLPYPYTDTTKTLNGVTFTDNKDGTISLSGIASANAAFTLKSQNTLVGDYISGGVSENVRVRVVNLTNGTYTVLGTSNTTSSKINKTTFTTGYIEISVISGTNTNGITIKPMMTMASDNNYEPYVGGTPAPNPSYPQNVNNVTGRQEIEVCGKNLCNGINQDYYINNVASKCGILSGNSGLIIQVNGGNYTISTSDVQTRYRVGLLNTLPEGNTSIDLYNGSNIDGTSNSITKDTTGYSYLVVNATDLTKIQIEKGSQATTYEPYIGNTYEINLGKNLVDITTLQTGYVQSDGTINTTPNPNQGEMYSPFINVKPNTTYTFSIIETTSTYDNWIGIGEYSSSNYSSFITRQTVMHQSYFTFTTGNNTQYVVLSSRNLADATKIQFETGTATSYSPYKTPIELCKIGDYQDYIYKNNNKWYIHKEIGKVIFNGSENWERWSTATSGLYRFATDDLINEILKPTTAETIALLYCDRYKAVRVNDTHQRQIQGICVQTTGWVAIYNIEYSNKTLEQFKTFISNNNLIVCYVLATPTDTEITDTELIEQLNAVELLTGLNQIDVDSANKKALLQFTMYTNTLDGKYNYLNDTKTDVIAIGSENEATKDTKLLIDTTEEIEKIKYKDETSGEFEELYVKALDSMPVGTQVEYTGSTIPTGWTQVSDYSETEIDTGKVWTENNTTHKIYRKVITLTDHPQTTSPWTKTLDLSNIDTIWLDATHSQWISTASGNAFQFPYYDGSGYVEGYFTLSNGVPTFNLRHNQNIWNIYLVVEYTKSS